MQAEQRPATGDEQATLARWAGWGAVGQLFDREEFAVQRTELAELLTGEEYASARQSTQNAHYTDAAVVSAIWSMLADLGFSGGRVLEPGCGSGHFLGLAPESADMVGVEREPISAQIAAALYPQAQVIGGNFAALDAADGSFDAAVGNVPFARVHLNDSRHNPERAHSLHNHFILKSLHLTRPGGMVAVLTSRYTMDATDPSSRAEIAKLADLVGAIRLPSGSHRRAAGTEAVMDLLVLRRREPQAAVHVPFSTWEHALDTELDSEGSSLAINRYFLDRPEAVLGEFRLGQGMDGRAELHVTGDLDAVGEQVTTATQQLAEQARSAGLVWTPAQEVVQQPAPVGLLSGETARFEGRITAHADGSFTRHAGGDEVPYTPPTQSTKQLEELRSLLGLRDTAMQLVTLEQATRDDTTELARLRQQLNHLYDRYVYDYGPINRFTEREQNRPAWQVFGDWCGRHGHDKLPASPDTVAAYLEDLRDAGVGAAVLRKHLDAIDKQHHTAQDKAVEKAALELAQEELQSTTGLPRKQLKASQPDVARMIQHYRNRYSPTGLLARTDRVDPQLSAQARVAGEQVVETAPEESDPYLDPNALGFRHTVRIKPQQGGFRDDPFANRVRALEQFDAATQTATKSTLFHQRTIHPPQQRHRADTAEEALSICLDTHSRVDLDEIARLLDLPDQQAARASLDELVFDDPTTGEPVWARQYLSGNVRRKLATAEAAAEADARFDPNVTALREVLPPELGPRDIEVRLGSWVPTAYVQQFLRELLGDASVRVEHAAGVWAVSGQSQDHSVAAREIWGAGGLTTYDLLEKLLIGSEIRVNRTVDHGDGHTEQVFDPEATAAAKDKARELDDRFADWLWEDTTRAQELIEQYNNQFNAEVPPDFSGMQLSLPGLSTQYELREHQNAAIARIIYQQGVGLVHDVGAGKTLEMIVGVMECKRRGLAHRPVVVVPNDSIAEQFEREWLLAYPDARLLTGLSEDLAGSGKQGGRDRRSEFVARAAANDYDAIIMTKESFQRIPLPPEAQEDYLNTRLQELRDAKTAGQDHSRTMTKRLERAMEEAREKLTQRLENIARDVQGVTMRDAGFDLVVVDEVHNHKKGLVYSALPDMGMPGSGRAIDLDMKLDYLQHTHGHPRAVLATATPWTNKFTEVYQWLLRLGHELPPFDNWVRTYCTTGTFSEMTPGGELKSKTRMRRVFNETELWRTLRVSADIKMKEELNLPGMPTLRGGEVEILSVDASPEARIYTLDLARRERNLSGQPEKGKDNHLVIQNDGVKVALDTRTVGLHTDQPQKVDVLADDIVAELTAAQDLLYPRSDGTTCRGGFIPVFCDLSTPSRNWNFYSELKAKLIDNGLEPDTIQFAQDASTPQRKADLMKACREGPVQVLVGSTAIIGAGVNMQHRAIGGYEITADYLPHISTQARGRVERQKNQNAQFFWKRLVLSPSMDAKKWDINRQKKEMWAPLYAAHPPERSRDVNDDDTTDLADVVAAATGDPRYREKNDLDQEHHALTRQRSSHLRLQQDMKLTMLHIDEQIPQLQARIQRQEETASHLVTTRGDAFRMVLDQQTYTNRGAAAEALRSMLTTAMADATPSRDGTTLELGHLGGFRLSATLRPQRDNSVHITFPEATESTPGVPLDHRDLPERHGLITRLENQLDAIARAAEGTRGDLADRQRDREQAQAVLGKPFPDEQRLAEVTARRTQLIRELAGGDDDDKPDPNEDPDSPEALQRAARRQAREQHRRNMIEAARQYAHQHNESTEAAERFAGWYMAISMPVSEDHRPQLETAYSVWNDLGRLGPDAAPMPDAQTPAAAPQLPAAADRVITPEGLTAASNTSEDTATTPAETNSTEEAGASRVETDTGPVGEVIGVAPVDDGTARRVEVPTGPAPAIDSSSAASEQPEESPVPVMAREHAQQLADSVLPLEDLPLDRDSATPLRQAAWWLLSDPALTRLARDGVRGQELTQAIDEQARQNLDLLSEHDHQLRTQLYTNDDFRQLVVDRLTHFASSHLSPGATEDIEASAAPVATNATSEATTARAPAASSAPEIEPTSGQQLATWDDELAELEQQHELDLSPNDHAALSHHLQALLADEELAQAARVNDEDQYGIVVPRHLDDRFVTAYDERPFGESDAVTKAYLNNHAFRDALISLFQRHSHAWFTTNRPADDTTTAGETAAGSAERSPATPAPPDEASSADHTPTADAATSADGTAPGEQDTDMPTLAELTQHILDTQRQTVVFDDRLPRDGVHGVLTRITRSELDQRIHRAASVTTRLLNTDVASSPTQGGAQLGQQFTSSEATTPDFEYRLRAIEAIAGVLDAEGLGDEPTARGRPGGHAPGETIAASLRAAAAGARAALEDTDEQTSTSAAAAGREPAAQPATSAEEDMAGSAARTQGDPQERARDEQASLVISHNEDGTVVRGTQRGDSTVREALRRHGFRWSRGQQLWYLRSTWTEATRSERVRGLVGDLRDHQRLFRLDDGTPEPAPTVSSGLDFQSVPLAHTARAGRPLQSPTGFLDTAARGPVVSYDRIATHGDGASTEEAEEEHTVGTRADATAAAVGAHEASRGQGGLFELDAEMESSAPDFTGAESARSGLLMPASRSVYSSSVTDTGSGPAVLGYRRLDEPSAPDEHQPSASGADQTLQQGSGAATGRQAARELLHAARRDLGARYPDARDAVDHLTEDLASVTSEPVPADPATRPELDGEQGPSSAPVEDAADQHTPEPADVADGDGQLALLPDPESDAASARPERWPLFTPTPGVQDAPADMRAHSGDLLALHDDELADRWDTLVELAGQRGLHVQRTGNRVRFPEPGVLDVLHGLDTRQAVGELEMMLAWQQAGTENPEVSQVPRALRTGDLPALRLPADAAADGLPSLQDSTATVEWVVDRLDYTWQPGTPRSIRDELSLHNVVKRGLQSTGWEVFLHRHPSFVLDENAGELTVPRWDTPGYDMEGLIVELAETFVQRIAARRADMAVDPPASAPPAEQASSARRQAAASTQPDVEHTVEQESGEAVAEPAAAESADTSGPLAITLPTPVTPSSEAGPATHESGVESQSAVGPPMTQTVPGEVDLTVLDEHATEFPGATRVWAGIRLRPATQPGSVDLGVTLQELEPDADGTVVFSYGLHWLDGQHNRSDNRPYVPLRRFTTADEALQAAGEHLQQWDTLSGRGGDPGVDARIDAQIDAAVAELDGDTTGLAWPPEYSTQDAAQWAEFYRDVAIEVEDRSSWRLGGFPAWTIPSAEVPLLLDSMVTAVKTGGTLRWPPHMSVYGVGLTFQPAEHPDIAAWVTARARKSTQHFAVPAGDTGDEIRQVIEHAVAEPIRRSAHARREAVSQPDEDLDATSEPDEQYTARTTGSADVPVEATVAAAQVESAATPVDVALALRALGGSNLVNLVRHRDDPTAFTPRQQAVENRRLSTEPDPGSRWQVSATNTTLRVQLDTPSEVRQGQWPWRQVGQWLAPWIVPTQREILLQAADLQQQYRFAAPIPDGASQSPYAEVLVELYDIESAAAHAITEAARSAEHTPDQVIDAPRSLAAEPDTQPGLFQAPTRGDHEQAVLARLSALQASLTELHQAPAQSPAESASAADVAVSASDAETQHSPGATESAAEPDTSAPTASSATREVQALSGPAETDLQQPGSAAHDAEEVDVTADPADATSTPDSATTQPRGRASASRVRSTPDTGEAELDRLAAVNAAAAAYFADQLDRSAAAQDYLAGADRLGSPAAVEAVRERILVGYGPRDWTGLIEHLRQAGISDEAMVDAGVATRSRTGDVITAFYDRITFAVRDEAGRLAGFTGRDLSGQAQAKYRNTAQTELYRKSELLLGVAEQHEQLASASTVALCEGPFDAAAIMATADEAGRSDLVAVAACGTAITDAHLRQLDAAMAPQATLVIAADNDESQAGRTKALATVKQALVSTSRPIAYAEPPEAGHDPASWAAQQGSASLQLYTSDAQPGLMALVTDLTEGRKSGEASVEQVIYAAEDCVELLAQFDLTGPRRHELAAPIAEAARTLHDPSRMMEILEHRQSGMTTAEAIRVEPANEVLDEFDALADLEEPDPVAEQPAPSAATTEADADPSQHEQQTTDPPPVEAADAESLPGSQDERLAGVSPLSLRHYLTSTGWVDTGTTVADWATVFTAVVDGAPVNVLMPTDPHQPAYPRLIAKLVDDLEARTGRTRDDIVAAVTDNGGQPTTVETSQPDSAAEPAAAAASAPVVEPGADVSAAGGTTETVQPPSQVDQVVPSQPDSDTRQMVLHYSREHGLLLYGTDYGDQIGNHLKLARTHGHTVGSWTWDKTYSAPDGTQGAWRSQHDPEQQLATDATVHLMQQTALALTNTGLPIVLDVADTEATDDAVYQLGIHPAQDALTRDPDTHAPASSPWSDSHHQQWDDSHRYGYPSDARDALIEIADIDQQWVMRARARLDGHTLDVRISVDSQERATDIAERLQASPGMLPRFARDTVTTGCATAHVDGIPLPTVNTWQALDQALSQPAPHTATPARSSPQSAPAAPRTSSLSAPTRPPAPAAPTMPRSHAPQSR